MGDSVTNDIEVNIMYKAEDESLESNNSPIGARSVKTQVEPEYVSSSQLPLSDIPSDHIKSLSSTSFKMSSLSHIVSPTLSALSPSSSLRNSKKAYRGSSKRGSKKRLSPAGPTSPDDYKFAKGLGLSYTTSGKVPDENDSSKPMCWDDNRVTTHRLHVAKRPELGHTRSTPVTVVCPGEAGILQALDSNSNADLPSVTDLEQMSEGKEFKVSRPCWCSCFRRNPNLYDEDDSAISLVVLNSPSVEFLPRQTNLIVLDMDETLLHSSGTKIDDYDMLVMAGDELEHKVWVKKRPYVDEFLKACSKFANIYVYTASDQNYADPVLNELDKNSVVSKRFYKPDCIQYNGNHYDKPLSRVDHPLEKTILVDNSPDSWKSNPKNAIRVPSWFENPYDTVLWDLIPILETFFRHYLDVRKVLNANQRSFKGLKDRARKLDPAITEKYKHLQKFNY